MTATQTRPITVDDVRTALEVVAAEDPHRRDRRVEDSLEPRYMDRGRPSCLVARVLQQLGYPYRVLRELDRERDPGDWRLGAGGVRIANSRNPDLKRLDPTARALLQWVQDLQDSGIEWGSIFARAFRVRWWETRRKLAERRPWLCQRPSQWRLR